MAGRALCSLAGKDLSRFPSRHGPSQQPGMPSHLALFVCAAVALVPPCAAVGSASFIRASNTVGDTSFYDEVGRVRIFHGGNRVEKRAPWYFDGMLSSDAEFALMKKMGVNVIRLGYMWSGVNPTNSSYFNATYI